jgi:hypothetical protein
VARCGRLTQKRPFQKSEDTRPLGTVRSEVSISVRYVI